MASKAAPKEQSVPGTCPAQLHFLIHCHIRLITGSKFSCLLEFLPVQTFTCTVVR